MTDTLGDTTTSTIGEQSTGIGTRTGTRTGRRIIPRTPDLPGLGQDDDDTPVFGVEEEDDTFGTGFLSGADAAATLRGDGAGSAANASPEQVDAALNDVFPGGPDTVRRDDPFGFGR